MSTAAPPARQASPQAPGQAPPSSGTEQAALAALVVILLAGLTPAQAAAYAAKLAAELGVTAAALTAAVRLLGPHAAVTPPNVAHAGNEPAAAWVAATAPVRRAQYLVAAARRQHQVDAATERRYLQQHLDAERVRVEAAGKADTMARLLGATTLGWYSMMDARTTAGCREMNGRNFDVRHPPVVEGRPALPGSVHGACRCRPGPPHPVAEPAVAEQTPAGDPTVV